MAVVFTEDAGKRIRRSVKWTEAQRVGFGKRRLDLDRGAEYGTFVARIVAWREITPNRWRYGWEEIRITMIGGQIEVGERSGTLDEDWALNTCEFANVAERTTQGNSVNQGGAGYPGGFALRPVGGGADGVPANEVTVIMLRVFNLDGSKRYVFQYENADDGECGPAPGQMPGEPLKPARTTIQTAAAFD